MKYTILFLFAGIICANGQIKIFSGGTTVIGTMSTTPSASKLTVVGPTTFLNTNSTITSAPLIMAPASNAYSTATTPDYTWWGNDQTGFFHPGNNVIGFTSNGSEIMRITSDAKVAIGTNSPGTYKFYVSGTAFCTTSWSTSDERFKKNVATIDKALDKVLKLSGKSYEYKTDEFKQMNFDSGKHYGFIAQELRKILPETVKENSDGYLAVNYDGIIPVLAEAIKEQNQTIEELKAEVAELKSQNTTANTTGISNPVKAGKSKLFQNAPNPFDEKTTIAYIVEQGSQRANIIVYNMQGEQLKSYDINARGNASLEISAKEFKPGMYLCSLIVDNTIVETIRMVITGK